MLRKFDHNQGLLEINIWNYGQRESFLQIFTGVDLWGPDITQTGTSDVLTRPHLMLRPVVTLVLKSVVQKGFEHVLLQNLLIKHQVSWYLPLGFQELLLVKAPVFYPDLKDYSSVTYSTLYLLTK